MRHELHEAWCVVIEVILPRINLDFELFSHLMACLAFTNLRKYLEEWFSNSAPVGTLVVVVKHGRET